MSMKKRGLSDVVTTGLVILLAIAAVVIVWTFVRPMITGVGEKLADSDACLTLDLVPTGCTYTAASADGTVKIRRGVSDAVLNNVKLIFYDSAGNSKAVDPTVAVTIGPLETGSADYTGLAMTPASVRVAGVINSSNGNTKLCPESISEVAC